MGGEVVMTSFVGKYSECHNTGLSLCAYVKDATLIAEDSELYLGPNDPNRSLLSHHCDQGPTFHLFFFF